MKLSCSHLFSGIILAATLAAPCALAQGVFEGSGEVSDPNCVGDGCGYVSADQAQEQNYQYGENSDATEQGAASSNQDAADSSQEVAEGNGENATPDSLAQLPADSTKTAAAMDTTDIDDEDEDRPHYVNESADDYRARKEGFSKGVQFGIRIGGGINKNFGKKAGDWNIGFEGGGGLMARLPLGRTFGVATELNFSHRYYSYESSSDYGTNKATIVENLFEIPVMGQYFFDEDGFFIGIGANLGLKMTGDSEFKQTITAEGHKSTDKRSNTIPTVGVEIGGIFDLGYSVNRWFAVDLRVIQNATNLIDLDLIAESKLMHSKLYTMHVGLGATFLL